MSEQSGQDDQLGREVISQAIVQGAQEGLRIGSRLARQMAQRTATAPRGVTAATALINLANALETQAASIKAASGV